MKQSFSILLIILATLACTNEVENSNHKVEKHPLLGEWEMLEVFWTAGDSVAYAIEKAQPGLFIISENRYALMWTPTKTPRTPFKELAHPTDEETIAGFRSVVFNAGTYQLTDTSLVTTAIIAKVPGFEGGKQYYRYNIKNDTLHITMYDETYPGGKKPEWYGQSKQTFIMKKVIKNQ